MKDALCALELFDKSEKTLDNYFDELAPTSVFHYLLFSQDCHKVLKPTNPCSKKFTRIITQRARSASSVDELRAVCLLYNTAASELNDKYGFAFSIIENAPKPEEKTDYDWLVDEDYNGDIAEYFGKLLSHT